MQLSHHADYWFLLLCADTFTLCEVNPYILITQPVYSDIHTNLIAIPLEAGYTMPYGLIYANEPTAATEKFIEEVKNLS